MKQGYSQRSKLKKNYNPKIILRKTLNNIHSKYIKFQKDNFDKLLPFDVLIIGHEIVLVQLDKKIVYNCTARKFLNSKLTPKKQFSKFESKLSKFRKYIKHDLNSFKHIPILYFSNNVFKVSPNLKQLGFSNEILHKDLIGRYVEDFYNFDNEPLKFLNMPEGVEGVL